MLSNSTLQRDNFISNTLVVPNWINKVLLDNNLSYKDVYKYDKIRKFLSLDDLVDLYSCYGIIDIFSFGSGSMPSFKGTVSKWWRSAFSKEINIKDPTLTNEYNASIYPLLYSEPVMNKLKDRLIDDVSTILTIEYDNTFSIIATSDETIVVIIHKGFINTISSLEGKLFFLRKYLEKLYVFNSISTVSRHPAFIEYVKVLQKV